MRFTITDAKKFSDAVLACYALPNGINQPTDEELIRANRSANQNLEKAPLGVNDPLNTC